MTIYTVHVPRHLGDSLERADRTAFVRDGFNFWAFVFGPVFLLRHRAWLATLAWLALVLIGGWLTHLVGLPVGIRWALLVLLELFLGTEGNNIRRATLERRGFDLADVVSGSRREDGERAFFRANPFIDQVTMMPPAAAPRGRQPSRHDRDVIGLFPDQEG